MNDGGYSMKMRRKKFNLVRTPSLKLIQFSETPLLWLTYKYFVVFSLAQSFSFSYIFLATLNTTSSTPQSQSQVPARQETTTTTSTDVKMAGKQLAAKVSCETKQSKYTKHWKRKPLSWKLQIHLLPVLQFLSLLSHTQKRKRQHWNSSQNHPVKSVTLAKIEGFRQFANLVVCSPHFSMHSCEGWVLAWQLTYRFTAFKNTSSDTKQTILITSICQFSTSKLHEFNVWCCMFRGIRTYNLSTRWPFVTRACWLWAEFCRTTLERHRTTFGRTMFPLARWSVVKKMRGLRSWISWMNEKARLLAWPSSFIFEQSECLINLLYPFLYLASQ
jgi:hypothetical protein